MGFDSFACCVAEWVLSFVEQLVSIFLHRNLLKSYMSLRLLILLDYVIVLLTVQGALFR